MADTFLREEKIDALIVGAGFGGIYQCHTLSRLGLSVKVIDVASDVGGTWYWNRYPGEHMIQTCVRLFLTGTTGAMSDTESYVYRYSWDKDDLQTAPWTHHYMKGPDVLKYLEHIVERHDLRKFMDFNTELLSAEWSDSELLWNVDVSTSTRYKTKYLITALGLLSRRNYPDIPGINTFQGKKCHTAAWDKSIDLENKRVGVIGCGSTGVQVITEIAKTVKELVTFQRHPQYSVPSGDAPVTPEYRKDVNARYDQIVAQVKDSLYGFGFKESERSFAEFTPQEREEIFETLWQKGNGFRFLSGGFSDVSV